MFPAERSASYIDLPLPASRLCPTAPCSPLGETHGGLEAACQSRHFKRFLALESERGILSLQHSTGVQCLTLIVSVLKDLVQEKQSSYGKNGNFSSVQYFAREMEKFVPNIGRKVKKKLLCLFPMVLVLYCVASWFTLMWNILMLHLNCWRLLKVLLGKKKLSVLLLAKWLKQSVGSVFKIQVCFFFALLVILPGIKWFINTYQPFLIVPQQLHVICS